MPIYEYQCNACAFEDALLEKMDAPRLRRCPQCGKRAFRRLVSAAGFQLKGGGWYVTDFRDKGKPKKKDEGEKPKDGKAEKTESKPDSGAPKDSAAKKAKKKDGGDS